MEVTQAHHVDIPVVQVQHIDWIVDVPVVSQRQAPTIQTGQKTPEVSLSQYLVQVDVPVETSQSQFIDRCVDVPVPRAMPQQRPCPVPQVMMQEVMDIPEVKQRRVSTGVQTPRKTDQTVEVARVIPHERILKPAGERASVRERVWQFDKNGGVSCSSTVEAPVHFSLCDGSSDQATKSVDNSLCRAQDKIQR